MGCTTTLSEFLISSGPLLDKSGGKRRGKAEDQTEEPQDVDPDSSSSGFKWCIAWRSKILRRRLQGDAGELLRYLSE
jgi:hypothetical protein